MSDIILEKSETITTRYLPDEPVNFMFYNDGCITAISEHSDSNGEIALVVAPHFCLVPNHALVKNYGENEGILDELIRLGFCKDAGTLVPTGNTDFNLVELTLDKFVL